VKDEIAEMKSKNIPDDVELLANKLEEVYNELRAKDGNRVS
jgi:hypothetical protein